VVEALKSGDIENDSVVNLGLGHNMGQRARIILLLIVMEDKKRWTKIARFENR